jgi:uncharacterized protein YdcH (DUF465 family)
MKWLEKQNYARITWTELLDKINDLQDRVKELETKQSPERYNLNGLNTCSPLQKGRI